MSKWNTQQLQIRLHFYGTAWHLIWAGNRISRNTNQVSILQWLLFGRHFLQFNAPCFPIMARSFLVKRSGRANGIHFCNHRIKIRPRFQIYIYFSGTRLVLLVLKPETLGILPFPGYGTDGRSRREKW